MYTKTTNQFSIKRIYVDDTLMYIRLDTFLNINNATWGNRSDKSLTLQV